MLTIYSPGYVFGYANIRTYTQSIKMNRRQQALRRKKRMGRFASYRKLGRMTGDSQTTVRKVLEDLPSAIPVNREETLKDIEKALDELEAQAREEEQDDAPSDRRGRGRSKRSDGDRSRSNGSRRRPAGAAK